MTMHRVLLCYCVPWENVDMLCMQEMGPNSEYGIVFHSCVCAIYG